MLSFYIIFLTINSPLKGLEKVYVGTQKKKKKDNILYILICLTVNGN